MSIYRCIIRLLIHSEAKFNTSTREEMMYLLAHKNFPPTASEKYHLMALSQQDLSIFDIYLSSCNKFK